VPFASRSVTDLSRGAFRGALDGWYERGIIEHGGVADSAAVKSGSLSADDELLVHLQAPPDLREGVESLAYWGRRRQGLPWYRLAPRREAARMTVAWERRVAAALIRQPGLALAPRLQGARLIAVTRLRRLARRVAFGAVGATAAVLVLAPVAILLELLLRVF
jgi:hypothetical protein